MSYVPPHARKNGSKQTSNPPTNKLQSKKAIENSFETSFPVLGKSIPVQNNTQMNFSNLFKEEENVPKEIKEEMKKGFVKLTKNGVIDSLTEEEYKLNDDNHNIKQINNNMIKMYNHIEKTKQYRAAWDPNYVPEVVIDEYSSSEHYTSEESDEYAEDPEENVYDL
jgi:uncharacterized protein (DUF608 family)